MNNLCCSNVDDHLIFDALNYPLHQFSTGNYVPQATRMGYTNTQPGYRLDDSLMIEDTYDDIREAYDWRNSSHSDNQRTYEENLELVERMGRVGSRLSEKTIMGHLKIRSYDATSKRMDEEADMCVICQGEYEKGDFMGGLQCGHEYHVECVKKWLKQHNSCPICKAAAVSPNAKQRRKDLPKLMKF